jgi:uncharacterized heparinase superfamily protein
MLLTETSLIYRGIRPLQKLGTLSFVNPLAGMIGRQPRVPERLVVVPPDPWAGDAQRGRDMIGGTFRFSGQLIEKDALSWKPAAAKTEWLCDLHGFEWLRDLRSVGGDRARRMAREMVAHWMAQHQKPAGLPWRADVTGVRLSSWISFHDFFCASADDGFRAQYFASLQQQARQLARALPGSLAGIALMRALKGLAYSGLALDDGDERLEQAFRLILREIRLQVLPDGGHVSRSPQATFEFFQCLVDLRTALTAARLDMPEELQHAIDRLAPAIKFFRHGDGGFCQFNGAQEGNPHICDATLMHSGARGRAMKSLPNSGYEKIAMGRAALIMDVGLAPQQAQYADRAHAGLLSFEYGFGKDRVIVNCGTSACKGQWRDLLRTTPAHSTLSIDGRNSHACDEEDTASRKTGVTCAKSEEDGVAMLDAHHTGYAEHFGLTHRRCVRLAEGGETLRGEDQLIGDAGVPFAIRFHLHPSIQASLIQDGAEILLRARSGIGWRFQASAGVQLAIEDSVYAGEGEMPRRALQIVLTGTTTGQTTTAGWTMRREKI